ncbi:MAG: preprotein translocase subunit SecG [bacterium]
MITILTILHVCVSIFLVLVVLLQAGKGASLSGLFGGGGGEAIFGGGGGDIFLKKMTTVLVVLFMVTSLTLAIMSSRSRTIVTSEPAKEAPQNPAPQEAAPSLPSGAPAPAEGGK